MKQLSKPTMDRPVNKISSIKGGVKIERCTAEGVSKSTNVKTPEALENYVRKTAGNEMFVVDYNTQLAKSGL